MKYISHVVALAALATTALDAAATDYSGMAVTFVGIPTFLAFSLLLAVLLLLRPGKGKRIAASTFAAFCGFLAIFLVKDSLDAMRYPDGWIPVAIMAVLIALSAFLFYKLMRKGG